MVGAILCSRLQPQPHCGRGTVQNHPMDHPTCFAPLQLWLPHAGRLGVEEDELRLAARVEAEIVAKSGVGRRKAVVDADMHGAGPFKGK